MAFVFPEDKQDFKAANGITYTYREGKWLVKTFKDAPPEIPDPLTYQIQTDKVLRSGEPAIELVDSEGYFSNVKFENDGLIDVYSNASSIVISSERIEEEISGAFDTQGSILMKNIEQDNKLDVHSDQINLLETQVQLLAQAQAVGKWTYVRNISGGSVRPPATATFYGTHVNGADTVLRNWSDLRLIMISKTDIDGTTYAFANFEEGDKIEILDTDASSACYGTVTNNPNQDSYGNLVVAVERSNGGPRDDKEYIVSVYRPGASGGEVDLDILDGRYLIKTGDSMDGQLKMLQDTHPHRLW